MLSEIAWLTTVELRHPSWRALEHAAIQLLLNNIDDLSQEEIRGRLTAWSSRLLAAPGWDPSFDESWMKGRRLLRELGSPYLRMSTIAGVLNLPTKKQGNPVRTIWPIRLDENELTDELIEVARGLDRYDYIARAYFLKAIVAEEKCRNSNEWDHAAELYKNAIAAIIKYRSTISDVVAARNDCAISDETLAQSYIGLAWCLHHGPRFDRGKANEAVAAYEIALATEKMAWKKQLNQYEYSLDLHSIVPINLRRLHGDWGINRCLVTPPNFQIEEYPFCAIGGKERSADACRFGQQSLDLGHGKEVGWYDFKG
jgi:hypothetical protein